MFIYPNMLIIANFSNQKDKILKYIYYLVKEQQQLHIKLFIVILGLCFKISQVYIHIQHEKLKINYIFIFIL